MNRTMRRTIRTKAMQTAIRQIQREWRGLVGTSKYDTNGAGSKLYDQQAYLAKQIAKANYTQDNAKKDAKELERALMDVEDSYARNVIKHMAWSRRYWHIACYEEMWSL